jgi:Protein kinase domain/PASTA domain
VLTLAAGLAEGLEEIHKAGVVHRDLKPSNVLLADDGPRIIDFGISRAAEATMLTQTGTVMGTPGFMSPEQAGGGMAGAPGDVFSLGAVLAFAATGQGPFGTGSDIALMYRAVHDEPDTTRLPAQLRPLVQRCLTKNPAGRPATSDLLAQLGEAQFAADWLPPSLAETLSQYHPPTVTGPRDAWDRTGGTGDDDQTKKRRRNHRIWAVAIAAAVIVGAAVFLSVPNPPPPPASVPAVADDTLAAAASALTASGFHDIPYLYGCYGSDNPGDVVGQSPPAGAHIARTPPASPVRLYLQAGNCYTVPDVVGMNLSNASYTLKQAGFTNIPWLYDCYGSTHIGAVVRQSPPAGTSYGRTQPVSLKLQANSC